MDPAPTPESYLQFYRSDFWAIKDGRKEDWRGKQQNAGVTHVIDYQRRVRIPRVQEMVGSLLRDGQRVLEVGCGHGEVLSYLTQQYGVRGYAVEPSDEAIEYIREHHASIAVVARSLEELSGARRIGEKFDLIIFSHSLENIVDINQALITVQTLLSDSGYLYIDTPNLYWSGGMNPYHPIVFTPETLLAFLEKHGFRMLRIDASPKPVGLLRDSLKARKRWSRVLAAKSAIRIQPQQANHVEVTRAFRTSRRVMRVQARVKELKRLNNSVVRRLGL